eukprot:TRINITY_DN685_c0_g1_i1.p1 TRINITY_DN685_c0_g1~~TRINITY_DN685_c0_g1_i1.p1  ORF type:complete len:252 (+),score=28.96 TRINITY_DN685_c0_g1_i1:242-997(+)
MICRAFLYMLGDKGADIYEMLHPKVDPYELRWTGRANEVHVVGSWNNWTTPFPLSKHEEVWSSAGHLDPGNYELRYIVDGEWRTNENLPKSPTNPLNNVITIRVVETPPFKFPPRVQKECERVELDVSQCEPLTESLAMAVDLVEQVLVDLNLINLITIQDRETPVNILPITREELDDTIKFFNENPPKLIVEDAIQKVNTPINSFSSLSILGSGDDNNDLALNNQNTRIQLNKDLVILLNVILHGFELTN